MQIKYFSTIIFLLISIFSFGQEVYSGKIIDASNNEALSYVNIGIVGKNVGTVSDLDGAFELPLETIYDKDILKISMIGYESLEYIVADFKQEIAKNSDILLAPQITDLQEVIISSTKFNNEKVLGNTTTSQAMRAGFETDKLGNEVGLVIKIKKSPSYIKSFHASIVDNNYGKVKFRLNFYDLKKKRPNKSILNENIIVSTEMKNGILSVDLTEYNIIVEDDFFVSLEWIESYGKDGLYFSAGVFGSPIIARETSQGDWEKVAPFCLGFNVVAKY